MKLFLWLASPLAIFVVSVYFVVNCFIQLKNKSYQFEGWWTTGDLQLIVVMFSIIAVASLVVLIILMKKAF